MPVTSASPGVARVARSPDNLSAFIMRKAFAARWHCGLSVASLGHLQRQPLKLCTTNLICSAQFHSFRQHMAWSSGNRATVPNFCTAHRRTRQRPHRWQCICCAARRDVALTLVSGAHGVYGLGTVPSEPRQWLRGACGHIECTISRFVYLLELEVDGCDRDITRVRSAGGALMLVNIPS